MVRPRRKALARERRHEKAERKPNLWRMVRPRRKALARERRHEKASQELQILLLRQATPKRTRRTMMRHLSRRWTSLQRTRTTILGVVARLPLLRVHSEVQAS